MVTAWNLQTCCYCLKSTRRSGERPTCPLDFTLCLRQQHLWSPVMLTPIRSFWREGWFVRAHTAARRPWGSSQGLVSQRWPSGRCLRQNLVPCPDSLAHHGKPLLPTAWGKGQRSAARERRTSLAAGCDSASGPRGSDRRGAPAQPGHAKQCQCYQRQAARLWHLLEPQRRGCNLLQGISIAA